MDPLKVAKQFVADAGFEPYEGRRDIAFRWHRLDDIHPPENKWIIAVHNDFSGAVIIRYDDHEEAWMDFLGCVDRPGFNISRIFEIWAFLPVPDKHGK